MVTAAPRFSNIKKLAESSQGEIWAALREDGSGRIMVLKRPKTEKDVLDLASEY